MRGTSEEWGRGGSACSDEVGRTSARPPASRPERDAMSRCSQDAPASQPRGTLVHAVLLSTVVKCPPPRIEPAEHKPFRFGTRSPPPPGRNHEHAVLIAARRNLGPTS